MLYFGYTALDPPPAELAQPLETMATARGSKGKKFTILDKNLGTTRTPPARSSRPPRLPHLLSPPQRTVGGTSNRSTPQSRRAIGCTRTRAT